MKTFKKILSILGVALSIVVLIACVLGIVGAWIVRANVYRAVDRLFTAADVALVNTVSRIDETVKNGQDLSSALNNLQTEIESKGKTVQDNPVVLLAVDKALDGKLIPTMVKLDSAGREIYAGLSKIDYALNTLSDSFLFRDRDGLVKQTAAFVSGVTNSMDELDSGLRDLQAAAKEGKSDLTTRVVDRLGQPIQRLNRGVNAAQSLLTIVKTGLQTIQARLSVAHENILQTITVITVFVTLLLVWLAYTQFVTVQSLLKYYWSLRNEPGGTTTAEAPVPVSAP
jgi:hypothetical protein